MTIVEGQRRIVESVTFENVDEKTGLVRDVRICGEKSSNGYSYSQEARNQAVAMYEGAEINWDHTEGDPEGRPSTDAVAFITNPRLAENGLSVRGDVQVYMTHPYGPLFLEKARKNPKKFGLSHVVSGHFSEDGREVTDITDVISVDAVRNPATNANLRESERPRMKVSQIVESLQEKSAERETLAAVIGAVPELADKEVSVAEDADPHLKANQALMLSVTELMKREAKPNVSEQLSGQLSEQLAEIKNLVAGITEQIEARDAGRELAVSVLREEGVEPVEDMVEELRVLENDAAMRARICSWPKARRAGMTDKPVIHSTPNVQESANDGGGLPDSLSYLAAS